MESGAGRDEVAEDDVLLESYQVVHLAGERRLGEHFRRLLEARGRDEARTLHAGLGDAEQLRARRRRLWLRALGRSASQSLDLSVRLSQHVLRHHATDRKLAVTLVGDPQTSTDLLIRLLELKLVHHAAREQVGVADRLDLHLS